MKDNRRLRFQAAFEFNFLLTIAFPHAEVVLSEVITAILILFAHWVGDYALQTSAMALRKYKSIRWLTLHVLVYALPVLAASILLLPWPLAASYVGANAALHWITDFCTSKIAHRYKENPRIYFPILGFDQYIHALCLLGTLELLGA